MNGENKDYSIAINTCRQIRARLQEMLSKISDNIYSMMKELDDTELRIAKLREGNRIQNQDDDIIETELIGRSGKPDKK